MTRSPFTDPDMTVGGLGQIVVLNGVPRSGKSSIAQIMQERFPGVWMNLGVDGHIKCTPPAVRPGVGLRPQSPELALPDSEPERVRLDAVEELVPVLYAALYESVAAHSRLGLNVVMDVNHHDAYLRPRGILPRCARRLRGLPVLFVGVVCPVEVIWERRAMTWGQVRSEVDEGVVDSVELGQKAVHTNGAYDLEVDTSFLNPAECAELIRKRLVDGPPGSRFAELAPL